MKTILFHTPAAIVHVGRKLKEAAIYSSCVNVVNCTFQPLCSANSCDDKALRSFRVQQSSCRAKMK